VKKFNTLFVCATLFIGLTAKSLPPQPHLERQGTNSVINPDVNGSSNWVLGGNTVYDSTVSQDSGTGSLKLTIPYPQTNYCYINSSASVLIPVTPGTVYTLAYNMRSDTFPCPIPSLYVAYYDSNQTYIRNSFGTRQSVTTANSWEECVYNFRPVTGEVYVKIKSTLMHFPKNYTGTIWLDNFYLGSGIGFEQAPTEKKSFEGSMTRVDKLGNVEIKKDGVWTPFFPISIYADGTRPNWSDYSDQGFNTVAWTSVSSSVEKAKDAGMMANIDLSGYIVIPTDIRYNNLTLLETRLNAIKTDGLMDSILFYYCDNENAYDEWAVPISVTDKIRELDEDANGDLMHPIYFLHGNEGVARKYNTSTTSMNDIVGDYITHDNPATSPEENRGAFGITTLDNIEGQQAPVVMAQINIGVGMRFRARLFTAIAKGAKGVGFWRDTYYDIGETVDPTRPPIEDQDYWDDLPDISDEIAQMMPLIRMPHWTEWSVASSSSAIDFGTRDMEGRGYIIATNESDTAISTTFTLTDLPYTATAASDYFTATVKANVSSSQFTISVPAYGSLVLKLENETEETNVLVLPFDETSGTTTVDLSYFANDGTLQGDASFSSGAISLDGTGDYVNCGNDASVDMGTDDMTIVARVKLASTQGTHVGIVTKGAGDATDEGYTFLYNPSADDLRLYISDGSGTRLYLNSNSSIGLNDDEWHVIAASLSRDGDVVFYVDGVNVGSESASALDGIDISNSSRDLQIGAWVNTWTLNGDVDNVKIYKKAISAQEITDISEAVLYLNMNANTVAGFDSSIYGNDGALTGDAALDVDMLYIDGTGDRLNCGNDASLEMGTDDMTIVVKAKMAISQNAYAGLVTKGAGSGTDEGYSLVYQLSNDYLVFLVSDGNGTRPWLSSNTNLGLNDNQWHTIAVSLTRSGNVVFYVDGVNVGSASASTVSSADIDNSTRDLLIGSWINNWHLNGNIDSVRIYKKALTAAEVAAL
jgi:Concanavalin A-like lectin/glucanases superfamily